MSKIKIPIPTPIYRLLHIDNLSIYLQRRGLFSPNSEPHDGLCYRPIHNWQIQENRHARIIRCGPGGTIHDYVPFYFGTLSPMLLQLHTGRVEGYNEGQEPLIYLITMAQTVQSEGLQFVFSDGHGIAIFTEWFDNLNDLGNVHWDIVNARYWCDTSDEPDRQRRKQAEFLIYRFCPWNVINAIAVLNKKIKRQVENILVDYGVDMNILVKSEWYY